MAASIVPYANSPTTPYTPSYNRYFPVQYFSGIDVSLFITPAGNSSAPVFIDEITGLQYALQEYTMPVYGYASYIPNQIIHGARIVEGQFSINMRPGDYLHELVNNLPINPSPASTLVNPLVRPDPNVDLDGYEAWSVQQRSTYWQNVAKIIAQGENADFSLSPYFTNNDFTIVLIYGDIDTIDLSRNIGRVRTIENVHLRAVAQGYSTDANCIQETFSFQGYDLNQENRQNKANSAGTPGAPPPSGNY
jgi:hypothetical protein